MDEFCDIAFFTGRVRRSNSSFSLHPPLPFEYFGAGPRRAEFHEVDASLADYNFQVFFEDLEFGYRGGGEGFLLPVDANSVFRLLITVPALPKSEAH